MGAATSTLLHREVSPATRSPVPSPHDVPSPTGVPTYLAASEGSPQRYLRLIRNRSSL